MSRLEFAFWLVYLATPLVVLLLARRGGISLINMTVPSVLLASYAAFAYVGILPLFYRLDPLRLAVGLEQVDGQLVVNGAYRETFFYILLYAAQAWVGLALGYVLFRRLTGLSPRTMPPPQGGRGWPFWLFVGLLGVAALTSYGYYLAQTQGPALLAAWHNNYEEQLRLRSAMSQALSTKTGLWWCPLLYEDVLSFLCFLCYSIALIRRRLLPWLGWLALALSLGGISLLAAQKAPLIYLLAGLFATHVLTRDGGRLTRRNLSGLLGLVLCGLVILATVLLTGNDNLLVNLASMVSRIVTGSVATAYYYLKFFPAVHDFLHGASLSNLHGLLPFQEFHLTRQIHIFSAPELEARGIIGSVPTAFWGEAYANFGPAGPFLVAVPIGMGVCLLQALTGRLPATPVTVGLSAWLILHVQFLSITSFSNYLTDQHLVAVGLAALGCFLLDGRGAPAPMVERS